MTISQTAFILLLHIIVAGAATVFTLENGCSYTIWPGINSGNGAVVGDGGFSLPPGSTAQVTAPAGWSGRFWARTGCTFDAAGNGRCITGDCGGKLKCAAGGEPPVTLAEFTIGGGGPNFYDVSLVDGHNVGVGVRPSGGSGDCRYAACAADVNRSCPKELQVVGGGGEVVACKSACIEFNTPEFCCRGDYGTPETCGPTAYSQLFKRLCPSAYSYAFDDRTSTFTCGGDPGYVITFCPE